METQLFKWKTQNHHKVTAKREKSLRNMPEKDSDRIGNQKVLCRKISGKLKVVARNTLKKTAAE